MNNTFWVTLALISNIANYLKYNNYYFWDCEGIDNVTLRLWKFSDFCSTHTVGVAVDDMFHILVSLYSRVLVSVSITLNMYQSRWIVFTILYFIFSCDQAALWMVFSVRLSHLFIRPFEKRTYYAVAMSVRPSVCPSVRVFRTFLQHALRYQFETWYIHSVGGTTCRVWVASQLGHFDLVNSQK